MAKSPVAKRDLDAFLFALEEQRLAYVATVIRQTNYTDSNLAQLVLLGQAIESVRQTISFKERTS